MTSRWIAPTVVLAALISTNALAERAPEDRTQATHVVVGKVEGVYARDEGDTRHYVVEIAVQKTEKGDKMKPGDTIYVRCYLRIPDYHKDKILSEKEQRDIALRGPGYDGIPKEGDRVRVYVKTWQSKYGGVYPDWYDTLEGK